MLNFQHLLTHGQIPANSFVVIDNKAYVDIGVLIGEPVSALTSPKVIEATLKLLIAANLAQTAYNLTAPVGQRVNSFPDPISGTNQVYGQMNPPGYYGTMQCSVIGLVPADINNVAAVFQ